MTADISQRIKGLNVLMTVLIVLLHTIVWDDRMWPLRALVNIAVPVFFVISAYLYFQNWTFSWSCYWRKLKSRLLSLYVPFVFYNLLYIPFIYIKTYVLHSADVRHIEVFSPDMVTSVLVGWPVLPNTVLWYLMAVLLFAVVAPLLGFLVSRSRYVFFCLFLIGLGLCYRFSNTSVVYWIPCLLTGAFLAFYEASVTSLLTRLNRSVVWRYTLMVSFLCYLCFFSYYLKDADVFTSPAFFIFRSTVPFFVIALSAMVSRVMPSGLVSLLSPYTFPIYCLHVAFVNIIVQMFSRCLSAFHFTVVLLLSFVVAFMAVLLLCFVLNHVRPLWQLMTGFRSSRT